MRSTPRTLVVLTLAFALMGTVGCSKVAEKAATEATEEIIEEQTGGKASVDVGSDGQVAIETEDGTFSSDGEGNVSIEAEDGSYTSGTGAVPAGWPDDIALPADLEVITGSDLDGGADGTTSSSIVATTSLSPDEAIEFFESALDGWEVGGRFDSSTDGGAFRSLQLTSGDRALQVTAGTDESTGTTALNLGHSVTPTAG